MGQCGPVNPCELCKPTYDNDPDWTPAEGRPGSYRLTTDADRRRRRAAKRLGMNQGRRQSTSGIAPTRLPIPVASKSAARRRRRLKQRRTS